MTNDIKKLIDFFQSRNEIEAKKEAINLLKKNKSEEIIYNIYGSILLKEGNYNKAIKIFKLGLEKNINAVGLMNNLAIAYKNIGKYKKSERIFVQLLNITSIDSSILENYGNVLRILHKYHKAEEILIKAIKINQNNPTIYNNLGLVYSDSGNHDKAITNFKKSIELNENFFHSYYNIASSYYAIGDYKLSIEFNQKTLDLNPNFTDANYNLGLTYKKIRNFEAALICFEKVLHENKNNFITALILETLYEIEDKKKFIELASKIDKSEIFNFRALSASHFASYQWDIINPYPFCTDPLKMIEEKQLLTENKISRHEIDNINSIISEQSYSESFEPGHIKNGYKTNLNIFDINDIYIKKLKKIILNEVDKYFKKYEDLDDKIISKKPDNFDIDGWYVRLKKEGQVEEHIHQAWLSGVFYLKTVDNNTDEGSLSFTYRSYDMTESKKKSPVKNVRTSDGLLVIFPSSLPHKVLSFNSNFDRVCIAFDIIPN